MATYKLDNLLNTTTGMTAVKSNQQLKNTDVSVGSVSWFTYAGKKVILYVSTDGYVNFSYFNDATRQLQVLYTNGTLTYLYKQEGQLESGRRFFKIRVQSYITTTSTSSGYALTYELFLIEGQILFLNVVKIPTQRNAGVPSSSITDGTNKTDLNISVGATAPIQITVEDAGVSQKVSRKKYADSAMTFKFSDLLSTNVNMNQVSTGTITGVDWFSYAGNTVDKIYTLDGSQIGFGQSTGHLKVCDKDTGKISSVSRLEGYLDDGKKFLKLRVTSYTSRSASSYNNDYGNSFKTIFEIFLIEGQILCINIVKIPTQSSYMGTSSIADRTHTENIDTSWNTKVPIQLLVKKAGTDQDVYYDIYPPKTYTGISVTTLPTKTVYYPGDTFNSSGLVVSGSTSDGQTVVISKGYTLSGFDSETLGNKTITVTFKQFTTTFEVEVKEDVAVEITNIYSARADYLLGEEFYFSSLGIKMESGKNKNIVSTAEGITVSGFDSTTTGEKTVTISYGGISKEVTITVHASATLEVIDPRTEYYLYDSDFKSPTSQVVYDDGTTESASPTFSGFDSSKIGSCEITVSYRGLSTTYTVNVFGTMTANIGKDNATDIVAILDIQAETLTVSGTGATKTIEAPSDSWGNYTGGVFGDGPKHYSYAKEVRIEDGITEIYGLCDSMTELVKAILPDSLTTIGSRTFNGCGKLPEVIIPQSCVTIGDNAFNSCQNAAITVLNKDTAITDSQYTFAGVQKIKGHYGSTAQSYADKYNYPFESIDTITKLRITKKPEGILHIGETLDKTDLEVKITLDTGEETVVTIYTIAYDFSSAGEKTVIVSIGDCSDSFTVNVIAYKFSELINTTTGMQVIRDSKNDDGTDTVDGVDWFKFNDTTVDKLYISGNNWIGFGTSAEQLKICRRDGAVWNVYRQETTLDVGTKVLKIRVEGYTYYSGSGSHESQIKYELFLFSNSDMYLNVIQSPVSSSSYAGTSSLTCNSTTTDLSLNGATEENPVQVSFIHQDDAGLSWQIRYRKYILATFLSITIVSLPEKLKYKKGEEFDSAGLTVKANYDDGESEEITGYTVSTPDMSSRGSKTVTVTYEEKSTSFEITVIDVYKIEVTSLPTKSQYYLNESFVSDGLIVSQVYTDGSKEEIAGYTLSTPNMTESGDQVISVKYKTFSTAFKITVFANITGIRISHYPDKVYYKIGEQLDTTGMIVVKIGGDGSETEITDYGTTGFDSSKVGTSTVTVYYNTETNGVNTFVGSDEFQVKITKDGSNPFENDSEPVTVIVHWPDGEFEDLTNDNGSIKSDTFVLQESICSESYFIFGGCISSQVSFEIEHKQFWGTDEDSYPSGRIEVFLECNEMKLKVFTGRIASAKRTTVWSTRKIVAYDYLYDFRNTDIARWYKNVTTDKQQILTQKQFRDKLFDYLGIEQVETKLHWDDTYVPNTQNANEMNVVNILKDLCLQNDRFGHMTREGKFEYLKLKQNSYKYGETTTGKKLYKYYDNAEIHLDTFKSFWAEEGRVWFPNIIYTDPDPNRALGFTAGEPTAQEAYENNVYYNRNSFFTGNEDWMDYVWDADEYGQISRTKPIMKICYGTFINQDLRKYYRAQAYTAEVVGNPLNTVGQTVELYYSKEMNDGTKLEWYVHSYIMSRTLKIGSSKLIDTYSANNAPFNSNSRQLGKDTPEISATLNRTRSEMPVISYGFSDGSDSEFTPMSIDDFGDGTSSTSNSTSKTAFRCIKQIKRENFDELPDIIRNRKDTIFMTYKQNGTTTDYAAFSGGEEIEDFCLNGEETEEIWGGNTLLWQKESLPNTAVRYAVRFIFEKGAYDGEMLITDEAGFYVLGNVAPKKIAYHIKKAENTNSTSKKQAYEVAVGLIMNEDDSGVIMVGPYNAHKEYVNGPAFGIEYRVKKDADGVYSWDGTYAYSYIPYRATASATAGNILYDDNVKAIRTTDGARIFYSLEKMKAWLLSDD